MLRGGRELWLALGAIGLISVLYLSLMVYWGAVPAASGVFGHGLGVLGFSLMLMTETLYSLRKRSRSTRWGKMSSWLQFHIFTGLVGPFLVLLHTSWRFQGLAGVVLLLTVIIVISGFIGRYIYTAVPRTVDGAAQEQAWIEHELAQSDRELETWLSAQPNSDLAGLTWLTSARDSDLRGVRVLLGRGLEDLLFRIRFAAWLRRLPEKVRPRVRQMAGLVQRRRVLRRQLASLAMARQLLGVWHSIHIPIGMALFTAAGIHAAAAIYFSTLLR